MSDLRFSSCFLISSSLACFARFEAESSSEPHEYTSQIASSPVTANSVALLRKASPIAAKCSALTFCDVAAFGLAGHETIRGMQGYFLGRRISTLTHTSSRYSSSSGRMVNTKNG